MLDRITKSLAITYLKDSEPFVIIKNILSLQYLTGGNKGAAWGIMQGKIALFIIITLIVLLVVLYIVNRINTVNNMIISEQYDNLYKSVRKYTFIQVILVILSAGAVGNLIDRITNGYVIDFIRISIANVPILDNFPIFNIADCYVTISVIFLIVMTIFKLKEKDFDLIFTTKPITKCLDNIEKYQNK